MNETEIYREAIIGFIVIKDDTGNGNYYSVYTDPICACWDGMEPNTSIDNGQSIVGILQAPAGTYRVYGFDDNGHEVELGYEYPGAYHPDWVEELKARRKLD